MQVFNLSMSAVAGVGVGVGGGIREYGNKTRQRQTAVSPYLSCAELKISLFAWDQVGFRPQPRSGRGSPGLTRSDRVEAKGACPEYEPWTLIWASVWVTQPSHGRESELFGPKPERGTSPGHHSTSSPASTSATAPTRTPSLVCL